MINPTASAARPTNGMVEPTLDTGQKKLKSEKLTPSPAKVADEYVSKEPEGGVTVSDTTSSVGPSAVVRAAGAVGRALAKAPQAVLIGAAATLGLPFILGSKNWASLPVCLSSLGLLGLAASGSVGVVLGVYCAYVGLVWPLATMLANKSDPLGWPGGE